MWRRLLPLACCFVLLLSGCAAHKVKPVTTGYAWNVEIAYDGMELSGRLSRESAGNMKLEITSPDTLDGVALVWQDGKIEIRRNGLAFSVTAEDVPQVALGTLLVHALDEAQGLGGKEQNGRMVFQGEHGGQAFELQTDAATGQPLLLTVASAHLTVTFSKAETLY